MLYNIVVVFAIHQHESPTGDMCVSIFELHSHLPLLFIPLGCPRALGLSALLHASSLHWSSILHMVSMLFSQIISPLPSPTESKSLFFASVSLLLPCVYDHHYHLSKFHIHAFIFSIGVSLSDLLHSV